MTRAEYDRLPGFTQSQVKAFLQCSTAWFAEYVAKIHRPTTEAFVMGQLFEARLCGEPVEGIIASAEADGVSVAKKDGELKKMFADDIDAAISEWLRHPALWAILELPDRQVAVQGEIDGYPVKGLLDCAGPHGIADIKYTRHARDDRTFYSFPGYGLERPRYVHWTIGLGYHIQAYWYGMLTGHALTFGVAKGGNNPDAMLYRMGEHALHVAREQVRTALPAMAAMIDAYQRDGTAPARACDSSACWFCPSHRRISSDDCQTIDI